MGQAADRGAVAGFGGARSPQPGQVRPVRHGKPASRPTSAGRANQLARAGSAAAAAAATAAAAAASQASSITGSDRSHRNGQDAESLRPSPRRMAGSRSAAALAQGVPRSAGAGNRSGSLRKPTTPGAGGSAVRGYASPGAGSRSSTPGDRANRRGGSPQGTAHAGDVGGGGRQTGVQAAAAAAAHGCSRNGRWICDRSPSPTPPVRGPVPMQQENGGVAAADAAGGSFPGLPKRGAGQGAEASQQISLVEALTRIAKALETGGALAAGEENAAATSNAAATVAAAAAIAASASKEAGGFVGGAPPLQGVAEQVPHLARALTDMEGRLRRMEHDAGAPGSHLKQPSAESARELETMRDRSSRLEQEIAELRAQCARRLDAAARESATSRAQAEEARTLADALRAEMEELRQQVARQQGSACDDPAVAAKHTAGSGATDVSAVAAGRSPADGRSAARSPGSFPQPGPPRAMMPAPGANALGGAAVAGVSSTPGPSVSQR